MYHREAWEIEECRNTWQPSRDQDRAFDLLKKGASGPDTSTAIRGLDAGDRWSVFFFASSMDTVHSFGETLPHALARAAVKLARARRRAQRVVEVEFGKA